MQVYHHLIGNFMKNKKKIKKIQRHGFITVWRSQEDSEKPYHPTLGEKNRVFFIDINLKILHNFSKILS